MRRLLGEERPGEGHKLVPQVRGALGSFQDVVKAATAAKSMNSLSFHEFTKKLDVKSLQEIKTYMESDKSNIDVKMLSLINYDAEINKMLSVIDYVTEAKERASQLLHDGIVTQSESKGKTSKNYILTLVDAFLEKHEENVVAD